MKPAPWSVVVPMALLLGCSDNGTPTAPSPGRAAVPLPGNEVLTGQVIDRRTSAPLPGATVVFSQPHPSPYATTDGSGRFSLAGLPPPGSGALVWAMAEGYEEDIHYYRDASQDFRLHPVELIPANGTTVLTVRPDDSLCWNNLQEPGYGADQVCRLMRIEPTAGVLTVEAISTGGGARPPLVVAASAGTRVLTERLGNPVSIEVAGATKVVAFVSITAGSPAAREFTLTTSLAPR